MKYLYFGTVCNTDSYEKTIDTCKVKPSMAPFIFESALLEGFKNNAVDMDVFSFPMIPAFPKSKKVLWGSLKEQLDSGYKNTWIPTINVIGIKQLTQHLSSSSIIKKWIRMNRDENKAVIIYSIYEPIASNIIRHCKKNRIKCYAIVPDLPKDMYANKKIGKIKKILTDFSVNKTLKIQSQFDGYIYLTKNMKDEINPDAPYTVVEGIVGSQKMQVSTKEKAIPPAVMYAGALNEKYGIKNIMDAFLKLSCEAQLWIYGAGDYEDTVVDYANTNSRIKFFGRKSHDAVLAAERQATLLINARNVNDEFTKYSFPSKTIEYMASGTPLLTTRLTGIPDEYFQYCYSIENNDVESLRQAMTTALRYTNENELLGKTARDFIFCKKNPTKQASKIITFIDETQSL